MSTSYSVIPFCKLTGRATHATCLTGVHISFTCIMRKVSLANSEETSCFVSHLSPNTNAAANGINAYHNLSMHSYCSKSNHTCLFFYSLSATAIRTKIIIMIIIITNLIQYHLESIQLIVVNTLHEVCGSLCANSQLF